MLKQHLPERALNRQRDEIIGKWQQQIWAVSSCFCFLAFTAGTIQIFIFPSTSQPVVPAIVLVTGLGLYTAARAFYSFRWYESDISSRAILGADIAICIFLVISTRGIYSPFIAYTLVPVATAGLLLHGRVTLGIAGLTAVYILASHIWNPFLAIQLSVLDLRRLLFYWVILSLVTALTYLINGSLRQRLEFKGTLLERQRLSHEIHDGVAQIVSALRWQAQFVQRRLAEMDINLDEVKQLMNLTEKLHKDIRKCLEFLRNSTDKVMLMPYLEDYQQNPSRDTDADLLFRRNTTEFHPGALVEAQLLYICREALANIRKHSGARETHIKIKAVDSRLTITITDDGCGFDTLDYHHDGAWTESYGLEVMRERAESIGGSLRVISMPGQGTEIQVEIPTNNGISSSLCLS